MVKTKEKGVEMRDYHKTISDRTKEQLRANCKDLRQTYKQSIYELNQEFIQNKTDYYNENFRLADEPLMTFAEMRDHINEKTLCVTNAEQAIKAMQVIGKARIERKRAKLIERNTIR